MNPIAIDSLEFSAETISRLSPYLILIAGVLGTVALSAVNASRRLIAVVCVITLMWSAMAARDFLGAESVSLFGSMLTSDALGSFFQILFLVTGTATVILSYKYLESHALGYGEYYALLMLAVLGMLFLVSSQNLLMIFLALELMSFSVYALVGFKRNDKRSNEAAIKYFLLGSVASAILLYGAALLYGATRSLEMSALAQSLTGGGLLGLASTWLILIGFLFKVACVPFHMWVPDVYEGAILPVTAFMTSAVKVAAFGILLRFFIALGPAYTVFMEQGGAPLLRVLALSTLILGNLLAMSQKNLKRLLAYSSIAHTGYLLLGFIANPTNPDVTASILLYLVCYGIMSLGAFAVLIQIGTDPNAKLELEDLTGLGKKHPGLAFALTVFLFSLAGLPPTAGFVAKYYLFYGAVQAGELPLVLVAVLASLMSVFYYLRILVYVYMKERETLFAKPAWLPASALVITAMILLVIQIGLLPDRWISLFRVVQIP